MLLPDRQTQLVEEGLNVILEGHPGPGEPGEGLVPDPWTRGVYRVWVNGREMGRVGPSQLKGLIQYQPTMESGYLPPCDGYPLDECLVSLLGMLTQCGQGTISYQEARALVDTWEQTPDGIRITRELNGGPQSEG